MGSLMASHFFSSQFFTLCEASQLLFLPHAPFEALLSLFFSISHSLRGISASFFSPCPVRSSSFPFLLNFSLSARHHSLFFSPCPVRSSSFSFLLNFSLSAGYLSFFSFSMPRPKLFFLFSSRFFTPCGASQLLFLPHAPSEALFSLFFSSFHSLRGISASFPSPCPVQSSSFSFLLVFSLSAGHLSFFFLSMPRPKLFFLFSSRLFTLCGASQLLFLLHAPSEALVFRL